jgi:D-sedoheptulose 7-phosphate isomerase
MDEKVIIEQYLQTLLRGCELIRTNEITTICHLLRKTAQAKGKIYLCGNGGSSSTASHLQSDLNRAFATSCNIMPAVCLTDNVASLTAIANDIAYEDVFCHQLKYLLERQDALVAISASGNSANVIKAVEFARQNGSTVVAMVGFDGGRLKTLSDYVFHVPVCNMQVVEDLQLLSGHLISTLIRNAGDICLT